MNSLSDQVKKIELKAERFDTAVDRIMELESYVKEFEDGETTGKALAWRVKDLIKSYQKIFPLSCKSLTKWH